MRSAAVAMLLILLCGAAGPSTAPSPATRADESAPALRLMKTIPLGDVAGRIDHMALDAERGVLFVAALGNNSVEAVDVKSGEVVARATRTSEPQGIRVLANGRVAVASGADGVLRIYDAKLRELAHLDQMEDADNVRYDAAANRLYVGYGGKDKGGLAVIDPDKVARVANVELPSHPESFQIGPAGKRIFVNLPAGKQVAVVDSATNKVATTWSLRSAQNFPMGLDDRHHRLLVACRKPPRLVMLDSDSGKQLKSAETAGDADDLWVDPVLNRVYVTGGDGTIAVHELGGPDPLHLVDRIDTAEGARTSYFEAAARRLYVAVPKRDERPAELRVYEPPAAAK